MRTLQTLDEVSSRCGSFKTILVEFPIMALVSGISVTICMCAIGFIIYYSYRRRQQRIEQELRLQCQAVVERTSKQRQVPMEVGVLVSNPDGSYDIGAKSKYEAHPPVTAEGNSTNPDQKTTG